MLLNASAHNGTEELGNEGTSPGVCSEQGLEGGQHTEGIPEGVTTHQVRTARQLQDLQQRKIFA